MKILAIFRSYIDLAIWPPEYLFLLDQTRPCFITLEFSAHFDILLSYKQPNKNT